MLRRLDKRILVPLPAVVRLPTPFATKFPGLWLILGLFSTKLPGCLADLGLFGSILGLFWYILRAGGALGHHEQGPGRADGKNVDLKCIGI